MSQTKSVLKCIVICSLLFVSTISHAQISKGNWLIGGSVSFSSQHVYYSGGPDYSTTNFTVNPNIGYFIMDKLAAGLDVSYVSNTTKAFGTSATSSIFGIGPFIRYYLLSAVQPAHLFVG